MKYRRDGLVHKTRRMWNIDGQTYDYELSTEVGQVLYNERPIKLRAYCGDQSLWMGEVDMLTKDMLTCLSCIVMSL